LAGVERHKPDVILVDYALPMASIAAESTGLPFATLWHTLFAAWPTRNATTSSPVDMAINSQRQKLGLEPTGAGLGRLMLPYTKLALTYRDLDEPPPDSVPNFHYVGPLMRAARSSDFSLPWPANDTRDLILVSFSTSYQNQVDALQRVADAVADLPVKVLMTLGDAIAPDELRLPENIFARKFIPHAAVLPLTRLVITHAGHGTVIAAATYGVPQLCLPMGRDQHVNGAAVERNGLGRVASMTASPQVLRAVIVSMLADESLRTSARAFAARQDVEVGRRRAISVLEAM
jgi:MGT family glycosyltransferase